MSRSLIRKVAGVGAVLAVAACGSQQQPGPMQGPPPAVAVTTTVVNTSNVRYHDEYPATVTALNEVDLRAQVSGYITGIYFRDGDRVKKGQKLYTIDQQQYEANYQQAIANLQVQEANLARAKKDADRYHELDKQDAVAKQLVDNADAALEAAQKQVEAAKAAVRAVQTSVRYTTIYAPFDGTIGISQVKMGSPVTAGQTVLNTLSSDNPVTVDFAVDQREIYRFSQLQQKNNAADSVFTLAFGQDIYPYPGKIHLLDRAVDPRTSTIKVRLIFPNPKNVLKPGMSGKVRVLNNSSSILIPYKAVTEQLGEFFVYVVTDSSKVTQRQVTLGKQIGTDVVVKEGLTNGEEIVVQGVQNLREGAAIKKSEQ
jgi:membrane fusion protein (multidrug efflux system)